MSYSDSIVCYGGLKLKSISNCVFLLCGSLRWRIDSNWTLTGSSIYFWRPAKFLGSKKRVAKGLVDVRSQNALFYPGNSFRECWFSAVEARPALHAWIASINYKLHSYACYKATSCQCKAWGLHAAYHVCHRDAWFRDELTGFTRSAAWGTPHQGLVRGREQISDLQMGDIRRDKIIMKPHILFLR